MDREKQIEEMTKMIRLAKQRLWYSRVIAEYLTDKGYRKITENEIIISKEEYEMLVTQYKNLEIKYSNLSDSYRLCKDANETIKQHAIMARKETAEKFVNELTTFIGQLIPSEYSIMDIIIEIENKIYEIAKQFGVDIGEEE